MLLATGDDYGLVNKMKFAEFTLAADGVEKEEVVFKLKVFKKVVNVFEFRYFKVYVVVVGDMVSLSEFSSRIHLLAANHPSTFVAFPSPGRTSRRSGGGLPIRCRCPGRRSR